MLLIPLLHFLVCVEEIGQSECVPLVDICCRRQLLSRSLLGRKSRKSVQGRERENESDRGSAEIIKVSSLRQLQHRPRPLLQSKSRCWRPRSHNASSRLRAPSVSRSRSLLDRGYNKSVSGLGTWDTLLSNQDIDFACTHITGTNNR